MSKLTTEERVQLMKAFYKSGESPIGALRLYSTDRGLKNFICSESTVRKLIQRFEETGSVADLPRSGRPMIEESVVKSVRDTVREQSDRFGSTSVRRISRATEIPCSSVHKILKSYLNYHSYRIHILQELDPKDYEARLDFAEWFLEQKSLDSDFANKILWSDEAHFSLDCSVYTRNCYIWAPVNPHAFVTKSTHPKRLTVWCGFTASFIIGPFFFETTVNQESYLEMLKHFLVPKLRSKRLLRKIIFQQDGAPPHIANSVRAFLENTFQERIISRYYPWKWPARSPDLAPCDYFLWGLLKARVYSSKPSTLSELKEWITEEISKVTRADLQSAVDNNNNNNNLEPRLRAVMQEEGGHFEHLFSS